MQHTKMIKKKGTFKYLFNNGKSARGKNVSIYYIKQNKNINYLGICVSKKNGNSVSRNKLKRWVREVYRKNEKIITNGYTIFIVIKKEITMENTDYFMIKNDIETIMKNEGFYEKNIEITI